MSDPGVPFFKVFYAKSSPEKTALTVEGPGPILEPLREICGAFGSLVLCSMGCGLRDKNYVICQQHWPICEAALLRGLEFVWSSRDQEDRA